MPYLMRGRNESCVYQETVFRVAATQDWLKDYNRAHPIRATLFHLVAYATALAMQERPRLNRFVSGGRHYQRREVSLAFVVKTAFRDEAAGATVKVLAPRGESFSEWSGRLAALVDQARTTRRSVDQEVNLIMELPGFLIRGLVSLARGLDHWNLYPAFMIRNDPMYSTVFLANLGSVGVSDVYHHLFEYGTTSIFGAVSAPRPTLFPREDQGVVESGLTVRWTFDERIDDAFSCAGGLDIIRKVTEDPAQWLGPPEGAPTWTGHPWT
ncbi:MAG: hypothetical protein HGB30_06150 [Holophagaceae bacterium]|nr:hypothetical protein [Holophagaceae bacterium]